MTVPRRPLLLLLGLSFGLLPACIAARDRRADAKPVDAGSQFAVELPKRPGEKIAANPQSVPGTELSPPSQSTSQRLEPIPPAVPPLPPVIQPAGTEPAPFPQITGPVQAIPESPLVAAVRASVENRPEEALKHLQALDKPNQDFALAVIPLLMRGAQMNADCASPTDVAALADQIRAVADRLEPRAALEIDKMTFCKKVSGFGRYDPWPENQPFRPRDLAELYVEIGHVISEPAVGPTGEGFVTKLVSTLEIRDANGRLIEQTDPDDHRRTVTLAKFERTDYSRTPPKDYFLKYRFPVPPTPGVYTVTVEVKDPSGKRGVRSKPTRFDVAGP